MKVIDLIKALQNVDLDDDIVVVDRKGDYKIAKHIEYQKGLLVDDGKEVNCVVIEA